MKCQQVVSDQCPQGHKITWRCSVLRPASCATCDAETRRIAERQQRDLLLEQTRQEKQRAYAQQLAEIQDEIDHQRRLMRERREDSERVKVLHQHRQDLDNIRAQQQRANVLSVQRPEHRGKDHDRNKLQSLPGTYPIAPEVSPRDDKHVGPSSSASTQQALSDDEARLTKSLAVEDWEHQKTYEDAKNESLDELMNMIGLENVKEGFLEIKADIDLAIRQNRDMQKERFGAALLGNPGTGEICSGIETAINVMLI